MKKLLKFLLILIFSFTVVNAKEAKAIGCSYSITDLSGADSYGQIQIIIDNPNSSSSMRVYYTDNNNALKSVKAGNTVMDYFGGTGNMYLRMPKSDDKNDFVNKYKSSESCPTLYLNYDMAFNTLYLGTTKSNSDESKSFGGSLRMSEDGNTFVSPSQFNQGSPQDVTKTCTYNDLKLAHGLSNKNTLQFYYKKVGSTGKVSFSVVWNGESKSVVGNEDVIFNGGNGLNKIFSVPSGLISDAAKKMENGQCISNIYLYEDRESNQYKVTSNGSLAYENSTTGESSLAIEGESYDGNFDFDYADERDCATILGENGIKLIKFFAKALRLVGTIIVVVNAMLALIPAVSGNNADELKKATSKIISSIVILVILFLLPVLVKVIANVTHWDACGLF